MDETAAREGWASLRERPGVFCVTMGRNTDNQFHNLGVPPKVRADEGGLGRYKRHQGRQKTRPFKRRLSQRYQRLLRICTTLQDLGGVVDFNQGQAAIPD